GTGIAGSGDPSSRRRRCRIRSGDRRGRGNRRSGAPMSQSGAEWGGGYVTDVAYLPGYYHHQSPLHLHLACLLGGVTGLAITPESPLSSLELACGCGFGTLALAASNPRWQVPG